MSEHAQLTAHDIRGPYSQLLVNLAGKNGDDWLLALGRFLRKENPWEKDDLRAALHEAGWTTEQVQELARQKPVLLNLRQKMFRTPVLDMPIEDFLTGEKLRNAGIKHGVHSVATILRHGEIKTVRDLVQTEEDGLLSISFIGWRYVEAIKSVLMAEGLHLGMDLS